MAKTLTATQQITATLKITDRLGNPAAVDGVPTWAAADSSVVTIEPAADGMSAVIKGRAPGESDYNVTADADLGSGVEPLIGTSHVTITPGKASVIGLAESDPVEQ